MDDLYDDEPDIDAGFAEGETAKALNRVAHCLSEAMVWADLGLDNDPQGHGRMVVEFLEQAFGYLEQAETAIGEKFIPRGAVSSDEPHAPDDDGKADKLPF